MCVYNLKSEWLLPSVNQLALKWHSSRWRGGLEDHSTPGPSEGKGRGGRRKRRSGWGWEEG